MSSTEYLDADDQGDLQPEDDTYAASFALEGTLNKNPTWYTPARLLVAFCVVSFLVFLDRGIIASNGVNGDKESGIGIQVFARHDHDLMERYKSLAVAYAIAAMPLYPRI